MISIYFTNMLQFVIIKIKIKEWLGGIIVKNKRYFFGQIFIIIILLLIVSGLTGYIVFDKVNEKNIEDKSTEEINKEAFDFSKVIDAINNNLNLSEQEKNKK